ncbi:hypothetical protein F442_00433 [Phytophthora nicotianae P10297]|uniref:DDE Tnp4 domain-containing protein n=1 Tax=Phytophthora nicotianae P10297 TaxID=1317064 RepID=W3A5R4_PHYNI|nr:hypothetical protein F442_00433 [Phytophthora nicotianae P10297]
MRWQLAKEEEQYFEEAVLFAALASAPPPCPRIRTRFNFNALPDAIPDNIVTRERTKATGLEALCVLLYKLAVPVLWEDTEIFFGRSSCGLSIIFMHLLDLLDATFSSLILFNRNIAAARLKEYSQAVFDAGSPYTNVWCFVDGTVRGVCRPVPRRVHHKKRKLLGQQSIYNGHKRKHALKFQTLVTPDGLISHLFGPYAGRNHDIKMYRESKIAGTIRLDSRFRGFRVFGDCAYGNDDVIVSPFEGAIGNLTAEQTHINACMSRIRVSVEWSYAQIVSYWKALDVKSSQRIGTQPVGKMYRVGVLMTNCITCIRGGNTASDYFNCPPPDISEYLES